MSLVTCPHCGNNFSSAADACARCGLRVSAHQPSSTAPTTAAPRTPSPRAAAKFWLAVLFIVCGLGFLTYENHKETARAEAAEQAAKDKAADEQRKKFSDEVDRLRAKAIAAPTAAAEPLSAAAQAFSPHVPGIGVTREALRSRMAGLGFTFEPGMNQIMGKNAEGLEAVQLLGPPEDVTSASITFGATDTAHIAKGMADALELVRAAMPDWLGATSWTVHAMGAGKEMSKRRGKVEISVLPQPSLGLLFVTVRNPEGVAATKRLLEDG